MNIDDMDWQYAETHYGTELQFKQDITYGFRPWGYYKNLYDGPDCKVKRIVVKPNQRLSYQYHMRRNEKWTIISGFGIITIDCIDTEVTVGDDVEIDVGAKHRIFNSGMEDLIFIEIQTGDYFGEDDIIRISDDYGR